MLNEIPACFMKPGILARQIAEGENKISESTKSLLKTMEAMLLWSKGQMEHFKPEFAAVPVNYLFSYLHFFRIQITLFFSFQIPII
jgi:hypothetical protein